MIGEYHIEIRTQHVKYVLDLKRKITMLTGKGAEGKTFLCSQIFNNLAIISSSVSVKALVSGIEDIAWKALLTAANGDTVFIVDESFEPMMSASFAKEIFNSDAYFVIITRNAVNTLPYSVHEIYTFTDTHVGGEYYYLRQLKSVIVDGKVSISPTKVVTEDKKSGYQFFKYIFGDICVSSDGKDTLANMLLGNSDEVIMAIADGAAFGSNIGKALDYIKESDAEVCLYLPESFEYLILLSGAIKVKKKYIEEAYNYQDDNSFKQEFGVAPVETIRSWERYFTALLTVLSARESTHKYTKSMLNPYYLKFKDKVLSLLEELG